MKTYPVLLKYSFLQKTPVDTSDNTSTGIERVITPLKMAHGSLTITVFDVRNVLLSKNSKFF